MILICFEGQGELAWIVSASKVKGSWHDSGLLRSSRGFDEGQGELAWIWSALELVQIVPASEVKGSWHGSCLLWSSRAVGMDLVCFEVGMDLVCFGVQGASTKITCRAGAPDR